MNPLHFGTLERLLFGVYHPAGRRPVQPEAVVVCAPWGKEYMRTHRSLKTIATELSSRGRHVLRFDYYGTGDSGGPGAEVDLERCVQDTCTAVEEIQSLAGLRRVSLVGVRSGGAVAVLASGLLECVDTLVLWDPVVRGSTYLDGLLSRARTPASGGGESESVEPGLLEVDGYALSAEHRRQLETLDLTTLEATCARSVQIVSTVPDASMAFGARLSGLNVSVSQRKVSDRDAWNDARRMDDLIFAPSAVSEVVACLS
jgi:pimeloyl-ACP methyl ester carboxylesterase